MDYTSKLIEKQQGRTVTTQELKDLMYRNNVSKYQSLTILRKLNQDLSTWITESTNWIFIYQGTTMIGGLDITTSRRARA